MNDRDDLTDEELLAGLSLTTTEGMRNIAPVQAVRNLALTMSERISDVVVGSVSAGTVPVTPSGSLSADNVQDALEELDSEKAAVGHDHDADYAAIGHDHDGDYAALDHDHGAGGGSTIYLDVNYDGSFDAATDDSANFLSLMNAAMAAPGPDGKVVIHLGPGTLNLSGLTSQPTVPQNRWVEVHIHGTQIVLGDFKNGGTSTYPVNARSFMRIQKGSTLRILGSGGAAIHGSTQLVQPHLPGLYNTAADWGAEVPLIEIRGIRGARCIRGFFYAELDGTTAATEAQERDTTGARAAATVTGDGSTVNEIELNAMPVRSDNGAQIFQVGDRVAIGIDRGSMETVSRTWEGVISAIDVDNKILTFSAPFPDGMVIPGPVATTTVNGPWASTVNQIEVADAAGLYPGKAITIQRDSGGDLTTVIGAIDGTNVFLVGTLGATVSDGNTVTANGTQLLRDFAPAVTFKEVIIKDVDWEIMPTNDSVPRHFFCGNVQHTVAIEKLLVRGLRMRGGRRFGFSCDSTHRKAERYQIQAHIEDVEIHDFIVEDAASGGAFSMLGWQNLTMKHIRGYRMRSRNEMDLTVVGDHAASTSHVVVAEDLNNVWTYGDVAIDSNGEATLIAFSVPEVTTTAPTTVNGAVSAGATAIVVASAASLAAGNVISFTATVSGVPTTRFYGIASVVSTTVNLKEALDGDVAHGATVSKHASNNAGAGTRGGVNSRRLRIASEKSDWPQPVISYHNIVAIDTSRGIGAHRVYFTQSTSATGGIPSGRVIQRVSNNAIPNNGGEFLYQKSQNGNFEDIRIYDVWMGWQGLNAPKGGEQGKSMAGGEQNNAGGRSRYSRGRIYQSQFTKPVDTAVDPRNSGFWIQQWGTEIDDYDFDGGMGGYGVLLHDQTPCNYTKISRSRFPNWHSLPAVNLIGPAAVGWKVKDIEVLLHPFAPGATAAVFMTHHSSSSFNLRGDIRDVEFEDIDFNSTLMIREAANVDGAIRSRAFLLQQSNSSLNTTLAMHGISWDGWMGRTNEVSLLRLSNAGRIGGMRFGSRIDLSGYKIPKAELIVLTCASNGTPSAGLQSTTLAAGASAGDTTISIPQRQSYNIPAGSFCKVTLNGGGGVQDNWVAKDSTGDGTLELINPLTGAADSGNTFQIRPIGWIELVSPERVGYGFKKTQRVASGQGSITFDIAGVFPKFRHSPGAPRPENVFIRPLSGDRDRVEVIIDHPVITPNDNDQTGGSIVWSFKDPGTPANGKNLTQDTVFEVGYSEPVIRFAA